MEVIRIKCFQYRMPLSQIMTREKTIKTVFSVIINTHLQKLETCLITLSILLHNSIFHVLFVYVLYSMISLFLKTNDKKTHVLSIKILNTAH